MKEFIEKNREMFSKIISVRQELAFSIEKVASECGVTAQTVRNFEKLACINPIVLTYYINHWETLHEEIVAFKFKY